MKLKEIIIKNFRGIRSLHLPLDKLTVLIGENNIGKSTILEAIRFVLSHSYGYRRGQLAEYDFHLRDENASPHTADPITIILHFADEQENKWPEAVAQQMRDVIQVDESGLNYIRLQVKGSYQKKSGSYETEWLFLNIDDKKPNQKNDSLLNQISWLVPLFFLSALRDASQEFGQRGQFWSGFLKSIQLPEDKLREIEEMLKEINTDVINANTGLTEVTEKIAEARQLISLDTSDPVVLEAIPTRVFDMVGKIQVHLKSSYGAKLPLNRHGEGTQNLAVLMLFQAFVAINLADIYTPESTPFLALEEPEAHLHPSAIRSLGSSLETMPGQVLITSHSGDLISRVPIMALRRLYKQNGKTRIGRVKQDTFTKRELQAIDYNIRISRGHYLFSRCWLLVEGQSEFHIMPFLFELMGYSQDQVNFSVVEISQVIDKGEPLIKFAKALGIQWFLMADGDSTGQKYVKDAEKHLVTGENLSDRARTLTKNSIEHEFWHNGYKGFIKDMATDARKQQIAKESGTDSEEEIKQLIKAAIHRAGGKAAFAQDLVQEVKKRRKNAIPQSIKDIITHVVKLSEG